MMTTSMYISTSWKEATDEITYLLRFHLQFPRESVLKEMSRIRRVLQEFQETQFDQL